MIALQRAQFMTPKANWTMRRTVAIEESRGPEHLIGCKVPA